MTGQQTKQGQTAKGQAPQVTLSQAVSMLDSSKAADLDNIYYCNWSKSWSKFLFVPVTHICDCMYTCLLHLVSQCKETVTDPY